ncbi:MAG: hypothetical protein K2Q15_09005, partial [Burkholderiales bacterium]|nr:hypothetical protein [Burkholderiales bacterium]
GTYSVTVNGLKYCAFKKDASLIPTPLTAKYGSASLPLDCSTTNNSVDLGDPLSGLGSWHAAETGAYTSNLKLSFDVGASIAQKDTNGRPWEGEAAVHGTLTLQVNVLP